MLLFVRHDWSTKFPSQSNWISQQCVRFFPHLPNTDVFLEKSCLHYGLWPQASNWPWPDPCSVLFTISLNSLVYGQNTIQHYSVVYNRKKNRIDTQVYVTNYNAITLLYLLYSACMQWYTRHRALLCDAYPECDCLTQLLRNHALVLQKSTEELNKRILGWWDMQYHNIFCTCGLL